MTCKKVCVLALALFGFCVGDANAQTLYGITWGPAPHSFISIDTTTGVGTLLGNPMPVFSTNSLAFRGGKLYTFDYSKGMRELNGVGASVNTINIGLAAASWFPGGLAFRSDGIGFFGKGDVTPQGLYKCDITVPNNSIVNPASGRFDGLAFDASDVLYGFENNGIPKLYTIDTTTGIKTLVGPTTGVTGPGSEAALTFDSAGNLYLAYGNGPTGPADLYKLNPATGAATLIGNIGFKYVQGLAFGTLAPVASAGVTITESGGSTNVTEGGVTDTYAVVLNTAPTANVTITINPGTQVTVAPATLTFTPANWNVAQTVIVTAVDDALVEGAHIGTITHTSASGDAAYSAIPISNVIANITDNDVGPPPPPPPPPPPAPGGGVSEGNYSGSQGLANGNGHEGTFGFGRHTRRLSQPMFKGPYGDSPGTFRVLNAAYQKHEPTTEAGSGLGVLGWALMLLAVLAPAALVFGRRRPA